MEVRKEVEATVYLASRKILCGWVLRTHGHLQSFVVVIRRTLHPGYPQVSITLTNPTVTLMLPQRHRAPDQRHLGIPSPFRIWHQARI
jgi:hypothetical protein